MLAAWQAAVLVAAARRVPKKADSTGPSDEHWRQATGSVSRSLSPSAEGQAVGEIRLGRALRELSIDSDDWRTLLAVLERERFTNAIGTLDELVAHARERTQPLVRMWLAALDCKSERQVRLGAALGIGLQLAAWTIETERDFGRGKLRVPVEELIAHGASIQALGSSGWSQAWAGAAGVQIEEARRLLAKGWPAVRELGPWRGRLLAAWLRAWCAQLSRAERRLASKKRGSPPKPGVLRCLGFATLGLATRLPPRSLRVPGVRGMTLER